MNVSKNNFAFGIGNKKERIASDEFIIHKNVK